MPGLEGVSSRRPLLEEEGAPTTSWMPGDFFIWQGGSELNPPQGLPSDFSDHLPDVEYPVGVKFHFVVWGVLKMVVLPGVGCLSYATAGNTLNRQADCLMFLHSSSASAVSC